MARVSAYEASDGSLHRDRKAYLRHETNLMAAKKIAALVSAQLSRRAALACTDEVVLKGAEAVAAFIGENINELRDILTATYKPGADDGEPDTPPTEPGTGATPDGAEPAPEI